MAQHNLPPSLFFQQRDSREAQRAKLMEQSLFSPLASRGSILPIGRNEAGEMIPAWPQMALDVGRALTLPRDVFQGKPTTMDDIGNFALTFMGGGLAAGAGAKGIGMGAKPGITAYHGSPHSFEQFSSKQIGTGEGAQVYGRGLYFAEEEAVAKAYRNSLSQGAGSSPKDIAARVMKTTGSREAAIKELQYRIDAVASQKLVNPKSVPNYGGKPGPMEDALEFLKAGGDPRGSMYEVRLNADPGDFLDWDLPLSKQGQGGADIISQMDPKLRVGLENMLDDAGYSSDLIDLTGNQLNDILRRFAREEALPGDKTIGGNAPAEVAEWFRKEADVPGIRYLDQGSRSTGKGTYNYAVFNDEIIEIIRKYGWAAVPPGLIAASQSGGNLLTQPMTNDH